MKKKLFVVASAVILTAVIGTAGVYAAVRNDFSDNDGVCDNRTEACRPADGCGNGCFVDADNDGVCDNRTDVCRPADGSNNKNQHRVRNGKE